MFWNKKKRAPRKAHQFGPPEPRSMPTPAQIDRARELTDKLAPTALKAGRELLDLIDREGGDDYGEKLATLLMAVGMLVRVAAANVSSPASTAILVGMAEPVLLQETAHKLMGLKRVLEPSNEETLDAVKRLIGD